MWGGIIGLARRGEPHAPRSESEAHCLRGALTHPCGGSKRARSGHPFNFPMRARGAAHVTLQVAVDMMTKADAKFNLEKWPRRIYLMSTFTQVGVSGGEGRRRRGCAGSIGWLLHAGCR